MVGMLASGKSRVGRDLARVLRMEFVDIDQMIEDTERCRIADIFERDGETHFRDLESAALREVLGPGKAPLVVSTGGGAIMRPENAELIFNDTVSIWLRASIPLILARTEKDTHRPLLKNADRKKVLQDMMEVRYPVYQRAGMVIDVDDRWPQDIVAEIIEKAGHAEQ